MSLRSELVVNRAETRQIESLDQRQPATLQGLWVLPAIRWTRKLTLRTVQEESHRSGEYAFDQSKNNMKQNTGDETDGSDLRNVQA
ncbi:MAG TPA: hypothetical protein DD662_00625 [Planctomycetaceae bacterium]|jgi:hypothetical protein|nr:MAG: hypothetical protein CBC98_04575 [Planctomycetaceae bacterium TMED138]HAO71426.1 hypothetical protein [Planctomycetaceae bacterium]HBP80990.1 hypothetical protein [Planctomycetaceae bacterium]